MDIFVLIIGGRYGSEISDRNKLQHKTFYDRYESITKKEYEAAVKKDIPIYILIETNVNFEYQTFLINKSNENVKYAHVDSINIFLFIEEILSKPRNNAILTFDKFGQIEIWLKEQWAGLFRDLINRKSQQNQIRNLTTEVETLREISSTLKKYIEEILKSVKPEESNKLIELEEKRLEYIAIRKEIEKHFIITQIMNFGELPLDSIIDKLSQAKSFEDFISMFENRSVQNKVRAALNSSKKVQEDFNRIRRLLQLHEIN